jgi:hypothetical protein
MELCYISGGIFGKSGIEELSNLKSYIQDKLHFWLNMRSNDSNS